MSFNLSRRLLSVISPLTATPQTWRDFVSSLFIQPEVKVTAPRVKKVKPPHTVQEGSKHCEVCGKKPRNPAAICAGPKKVLTNSEPSA
jgi:hypothetical protein